MSTTLEQIREQQRKVKLLEHKLGVANAEYSRLSKLKNEASLAQDNAQSNFEDGQRSLRDMGRDFALDLSEVDFTPPMQVTEI